MSRFDTYLPSARLKPFIKHYAISESQTQQSYRVLPSTSLVMGVQYSGRLSRLIDQTPIPLHRVGVSGLQDRFTLFGNTDHTSTLLIYFKETGAAAFFPLPLHDLFAQSVALDRVMPSSLLEAFEERLRQATTDKQRIDTVEHLLLAQLSDRRTDLLVAKAVDQIYQAKGLIRIKHLATRLNISQSPFEKRFRQLVGATPKKFATIVRFQSLLSAHSSGVDLADLTYLFDYYDQSHFINEFKRFTGDTPTRFFSHQAAYPTALIR